MFKYLILFISAFYVYTHTKANVHLMSQGAVCIMVNNGEIGITTNEMTIDFNKCTDLKYFSVFNSSSQCMRLPSTIVSLTLQNMLNFYGDDCYGHHHHCDDDCDDKPKFKRGTLYLPNTVQYASAINTCIKKFKCNDRSTCQHNMNDFVIVYNESLCNNTHHSNNGFLDF